MSQKRNRRVFDQQFKQDAVDLVTSQGRSIASVARELGIDQNSPHTWTRQLASESVGEGSGGAAPASGKARVSRATTTRSPRPFSTRSKPNACSSRPSSRGSMRTVGCSATSKASTTHDAGTRRSEISHRHSSNGNSNPTNQQSTFSGQDQSHYWN